MIGRTDYYGYHNWRSKLVCYSDKLSKLTNLPCYHMEWRLQSHAAIKAEGVFGVDDLMYFEHRKFWAKKLRLCELDYIKFGKRLLHQNFNTPSRYRTDYRGRRINLNELHARSEIRIIDYDRPDWSELPPVTLMEILVAVKDKVRNVKDFLIPLGAAHLLPVCPRRPTVR